MTSCRSPHARRHLLRIMLQRSRYYLLIATHEIPNEALRRGYVWAK